MVKSMAAMIGNLQNVEIKMEICESYCLSRRLAQNVFQDILKLVVTCASDSQSSSIGITAILWYFIAKEPS